MRWFLVIAMLCLLGCDPPDPPRERAAAPEIVETRPAWTEAGGTLIVAAALDPELEAAIAQARATAADARVAWLDATGAERENWAIKWAAPVRHDETAERENDGAIEYVWVRPVSWSPFRIEGTLASPPQGDIGAQPGDLVAFPVEELADWVYMREGTMNGPRDGGFTVTVLEGRFGAP